MGMTRVTTVANEREKQSRDGEHKLLRSGTCRPTPLTEKAFQVKGNSKKNLEGLYEVLSPGSNFIKASPTTSTIKEPDKAIVTAMNSAIAKFGILQARPKR